MAIISLFMSCRNCVVDGTQTVKLRRTQKPENIGKRWRFSLAVGAATEQFTRAFDDIMDSIQGL
jgi:hypothetical protein